MIYNTYDRDKTQITDAKTDESKEYVCLDETFSTSVPSQATRQMADYTTERNMT